MSLIKHQSASHHLSLAPFTFLSSTQPVFTEQLPRAQENVRRVRRDPGKNTMELEFVTPIPVRIQSPPTWHVCPLESKAMFTKQSRGVSGFKPWTKMRTLQG